MFALFLLFGLLVGSFANVVILRLHNGKKGIADGRSECPKCHHVLEFFDLIPVVSWLFLRGKCRYCQKKISIQYPLVELTMAVLWGVTAFLNPITFTSTGLEWIRFLLLLFVISSLLIITIYDLKYLEIPDQVSLPLLGILLVALPFGFFTSWQSGLMGAAIVVGFFLLQIIISQGKWIGGGDLRLGAIMGLLLGWQKALIALFLAYLVGALIGVLLLALQKKGFSSQIPFGPFLALGTFLAFFWGDALLFWYLEISGLGLLFES